MSVPAGPAVRHPVPRQPRVVLLGPLVRSPLIEVGKSSYYNGPDAPSAFETRNVPHHCGPEKLVIGRFCAPGTGVRFIMNGANHRLDGPSAFPPHHGRFAGRPLRPAHRPARPRGHRRRQ